MALHFSTQRFDLPLKCLSLQAIFVLGLELSAGSEQSNVKIQVLDWDTECSDERWSTWLEDAG